MKEKTKLRIKGSISIFLTILLIPMLCVSGLIVDGSRTELAKGTVNSAGDLTMNAALANYDTVLKDVYGLFAMSQSKEDLQKNLRSYFAKTLVADNIIDDESEVESNQELKEASDAFAGDVGSSSGSSDDSTDASSKKYSNLLTMKIGDGTDDFTVTKLPNSSLANPAILKNQIVDYMKYRTPVDAGLSLLDGLSALKKITKQANVAQAKVQVDEDAQDFNSTCENLYKLLNEYNMEIGNYGNYTWKETEVYHKDDYKVINNAAVILMYYERATEYFKGIGNARDFNYSIENGENNFGSFNEDEIENANEAVTNAIDSIKEKTFGTTVVKPLSDNINNSSMTIQEKIKYQKLYKTYYSKINSLLESVMKIKNEFNSIKDDLKSEEEAKADVEKDKNNPDREQDLKEIKKEIARLNALKNSWKGVYDSACSQAYSYMNTAVKISNCAKKIDGEIDSKKKEIDGKASAVAADTNGKITWFTDCQSKLTEALDQIQAVKDAADKINADNAKFDNSIKKYDGKDGKKSDSFSESMANEQAYNASSYKIENIDLLESQLKAHQNMVSAVLDELKETKYAGTAVTEIKSFDNAANALKNYSAGSETYGTQIKATYDTNPLLLTDAYADKIFATKGVYTGQTYPKATITYAIDNDTKIAANDKFIQQLAGTFWDYLVRAFSNKTANADAQKQKDDMVDGANGTSTETIPNAQNIPGITIFEQYKGLLPSSGQAAAADAASSGSIKIPDSGFADMLGNITGFFSDFGNNIEKIAENARDNIYVTDYVFKMFSYHTIENEYKVNQSDDGNTTDTTKSLEELGLGPIKSETDININAKNNPLYGAEAEYILYGNKYSSENIKQAKIRIFAVRFVMNSYYALGSRILNIETKPIALAIQGATLIPAKLTQSIMELALALAETNLDMQAMESGKKVPLKKSDETWTMSLTGLIEAAKNKAKNFAESEISKATGKITGALNKLIDGAADKAEVAVDDVVKDVNVTAEGITMDAVGKMFSTFSDSVTASLNEILVDGKNAAETAEKQADDIIDNAVNAATQYITSSGDDKDNIVQKILSEYLKSYITDKAVEMKASLTKEIAAMDNTTAAGIISEFENTLSDKLSKYLKTISEEIGGKIKSKITEYQNDVKNNICKNAKNVSDEVSQKVVDATDKFFDDNFSKYTSKAGTAAGSVISGKKSKNSAFSSLLNFGYSDYLKMFMFVGLCTDNSDTIKRIADVIQINVANGLADTTCPETGAAYKDAAGDSFLMSEAYTYVELSANVKLKTMFISLPFVKNYTGESADYFNIRYKSVLGY